MELTINKKYLVFDLTKNVTKDGRKFIRVVLAEEGGSLINGIMFDITRLTFDVKKGDLVDLEGVLHTYNDQPQIKIIDMKFLSEAPESAFLPRSKFTVTDMVDELESVILSIKDEWLSKLALTFCNDKINYEKFQYMPAAKSVHHAYIHGLLEHTLSVAKLAKTVAPLYPNVNVDFLIIGALFHDIGKIFELEVSAGFDYSTEGKFLGHLLLGYSLIEKYIDSIENFPLMYKNQILHMIASHHGQLEYGSPQLPKTIEALMLSFVDDLDAKMNAVDSIFMKEKVEESKWSNYDRLLERQFFKNY